MATSRLLTAGVLASLYSRCASELIIVIDRLADQIYRLTNASPFIDPSDATDVKTKILERFIDWNTLDQYRISSTGRSIVQALLAYFAKIIN